MSDSWIVWQVVPAKLGRSRKLALPSQGHNILSIEYPLVAKRDSPLSQARSSLAPISYNEIYQSPGNRDLLLGRPALRVRTA
jgi:hypothetical protein